MQQEDGDSKSGGEGGHHRSLSDNGDDEDELIDMDDCMSGDED